MDLSDSDRTWVEQHYRDWVMHELRSPSTASFVDQPNIFGVYNDALKSGTVYCTGHVDAQNGFGAMIRQRYTIILKKDRRLWMPESVTLY